MSNVFSRHRISSLSEDNDMADRVNTDTASHRAADVPNLNRNIFEFSSYSWISRGFSTIASPAYVGFLVLHAIDITLGLAKGAQPMKSRLTYEN